MKMSLFLSMRGKMQGDLCTWDLFKQCIDSPTLSDRAAKIAAGHTELTSTLPAVTWQAYFADGERTNRKAEPNGLFVLEVVDAAESPAELWSRIAPHRKKLGIRVAHKDISTLGLLLVADCHPGLGSLAENQQWLATTLAIDTNTKCKEWSHASCLVPRGYFYHLDKSIFDPAVEAPIRLENKHEGSMRTMTKANEKIPQTSAIISTLDALHDATK